MSYKLIESLLIILIIGAESRCPFQYNEISQGCYKICNGTNLTWSDAQQFCLNDHQFLSQRNETEPNSKTHLIALENVREKTGFLHWLKAYSIENEFWIDGIVSNSSWSWSNQSITWYFEEFERAVVGNGVNYKLSYNRSNQTYQIADDIDATKLSYICEYQKLCNGSYPCKNNGTCYQNAGGLTCLCVAGFTGDICDTNIDECLSSPCLHGGQCIDDNNNYTCNCSDIFYTGANCEIEEPDPTQNDRAAAFWSVVGVVAGLVVILTLSDLPWEDIIHTIGCSSSRSKCCPKQKDNKNININEKDLHLSNSPVNDENIRSATKLTSDGTIPLNGTNYRVVNTVWNPEYVHNQTSSNPQYDGYRSPDENRTPDNVLIQSFAVATMAKQQQKELEEKRIFAVNINGSTSTKPESKDPVNTMVSWTEQLQEQLRNKKSRETSADSTKKLIESPKVTDC